MKVEMIFAVEWTTQAVVKEPENFQAWSGIELTVVCSPVGLIGLMARALPPVIAHKGKGSNLDQALIFSGSLSTA